MSFSPVSDDRNRINVELGNALSEFAAENNMSLDDKLNPQLDAGKVDGRLDTNRSRPDGYDPDFIRPGDTIIASKNGGTTTIQYTLPKLDGTGETESRAQSLQGKPDLNDGVRDGSGGRFAIEVYRNPLMDFTTIGER